MGGPPRSRHRLPHAVRTGLPLRREFTTLDGPGAGRRRGRRSARARAHDAARRRRVAGAARLNTVLPRSPRPGDAGASAARAGTGKTFPSPARAEGRPTRDLHRRIDWPTPPRLVVARAALARSASYPVGLPPFIVRCRWASASSGSSPRPSWPPGRAAGRRRRADSPTGAVVGGPVAGRSARLETMGAAAAAFGRPTPTSAATSSNVLSGPGATVSLVDLRPNSPSTRSGGCTSSPGGAGMSAMRGSCSPVGSGVGQRRPAQPDARRAGRGREQHHVGHAAATSPPMPHRRHLHGDPEDNPERAWPPRGLRVLPRAAALAALMAGRTAVRSRHPPPRPDHAMSPWRSAAAASTRPSRSAGDGERGPSP